MGSSPEPDREAFERCWPWLDASFALSRTAPQAPSCRARVMRHQAAVTGDKGRGQSPL